MLLLRFNLCLVLILFSLQPEAQADITYAPGKQGYYAQTGNTEKLNKLNSDLLVAISQGREFDDKEKLMGDIDSLLECSSIEDSLVFFDAYYITGVHLVFTGRYQRALERFLVAERMKNLPDFDSSRYSNCLNNISICYFYIGDFAKAIEYGTESMRVERSLVGRDSVSLASGYLNLASSYIQMNDFEKAMSCAETGLEILRLFPDQVDTLTQATLFHDIGICFDRKSELSRALDYFRQAFALYSHLESTVSNEPKQLLYLAIAETYRKLKMPSEAEKIYREGLSFVSSEFLGSNYVIFIDYAEFLLEMGRSNDAYLLFVSGLERVAAVFGIQSKEYCRMLIAQADFIYKASGNGQEAADIYSKCLDYLDSHKDEYALRNTAITGYSAILIKEKQYHEAIGLLDRLLEPDSIPTTELVSTFDAGSVLHLSPEYLRRILELKYEALDALSDNSRNTEFAYQAIETGKALVSLYDLFRVNMSEEESRNYLSANVHSYYYGMIENFAAVYARTKDPSLLKGAFEFIERSKVAGFLTAMRGINASRLSLPQELAQVDNNLGKQIGKYRELITNESEKNNPDSLKIAAWEHNSFVLLRSKDSLVKVFEKKYPGYYSLKYKTDITPLSKTGKVLGREANLISYVLSDTSLFIFVSNRKHKEIIARRIDSTFYSDFERFRRVLSTIPDKSSARDDFRRYMDLGYSLYKVLMEPVVPFLDGDKIVISPDNVISYLPFETLITEEYNSDDLLYREAPFALKKYRFSYVYSVTLSSELTRNARSVRNRLIAFAPSYDDMAIPDSLLNLYPNLRGSISVLPYAVEEAEDAVKQCGGKAYLKASATEEAFKSDASKYSIVHLAMHTLINDQYPGFSKMIFSGSESGTEDGFLNTYEVYSNPLHAMMVVLSSCNTGTGVLLTGEGILSLARGFLFAGSRSVVMSMWEVEDYSGASVVRSFYHYLRKGQSKSTALRSARLKFLKEADQVRSHPYYWATLVIYGDDSSLYFGKTATCSAIVFLFLVAIAVILYFYKEPRS